MSEQAPAQEIRGVLLPLKTGQLLLPNTSVAEVIGLRDPEQQGDAERPWLMGWFNWRHQTLPLVDFDRVLGERESAVNTRARIAICHATGGNPKLPYIGLKLQAIPHLVRVTEEVIALPEGEVALPPMTLCQLQLNGREAWIPDLEALEQALPTPA